MDYANVIIHTLQEAGFEKVIVGGGIRVKEEVWARGVSKTGFHIYVYTTVVNGSARAVGKDAIRVQVVKEEKHRARILWSATRVHRTGEEAAVSKRMLGRMREAWKEAKKIPLCHCGAPKFKSKKNNMVCSAFCWEEK